jgi:hypothetical protein
VSLFVKPEPPSVLLVSVSVVARPTYVSVPWKVRVVESVPASVRLLFAVKVLPFAIVSVADVAGAVIATLLIEVADAAPKVGVTNVMFVHVPVGV